MTCYAIGDVQGCYDELRKLLDKLEYDPAEDCIWLCGDLVNRGPKSLEVLRFVKSLGRSAISVLGNHDLHLLANAYGNGKHREDHSLDAVLAAPDATELINWLRRRPLMHSDDHLGAHMIHAGLPPEWDIPTARRRAREVELRLREKDPSDFFAEMYGNKPDRWNDTLQGMERLRFITNCFTRLRYCKPNGKLCLKEKGPIGSQAADCLPWFRVPKRASAGERILFGHWSTLGYHNENNIWALDSGCLWGGALTALNLKRYKPVRVDCKRMRETG